MVGEAAPSSGAFIHLIVFDIIFIINSQMLLSFLIQNSPEIQGTPNK
jgi:hypothetical protein